MDDLPNPRLEAAKAIYAKFVRISEPDEINRRWNCMSEKSRERWLAEASTCIDTFLYFNEMIQ